MDCEDRRSETGQRILTCVWDEGDLEERPNHGRDVARLVVPQGTPLGNHQLVHGQPHITIATQMDVKTMLITCTF